MSKEEDYKIIEQYLLDQLSETERKAFQDRCESDATFNELFLQEQDLFNALEVEGNHEMKAVLQGLESQHQAKIIKMNPKRKLLRLIAGFLFFPLCFFLFKTYNAPNNQELFSEYYSIYPNELVDIERGDGESSELKETMVNYSSGNYNKAIEGFDKLLATQENPEIKFYKGLAFLGKGDSKEAINILNSLSPDKEFKFHEALPWYKSLALLKENKVTLAKLELNKIIDSGQSFRQQSAKKLLKSLK